MWLTVISIDAPSGGCNRCELFLGAIIEVRLIFKPRPRTGNSRRCKGPSHRPRHPACLLVRLGLCANAPMLDGPILAAAPPLVGLPKFRRELVSLGSPMRSLPFSPSHHLNLPSLTKARWIRHDEQLQLIPQLPLLPGQQSGIRAAQPQLLQRPTTALPAIPLSQPVHKRASQLVFTLRLPSTVAAATATTAAAARLQPLRQHASHVRFPAARQS